jgi:hypothetical protein
LSFSGKALWIISTSAFLIGVPWALAYAEEEQYIQMEREQGMIKGANEVSFCRFIISVYICLWTACHFLYCSAFIEYPTWLNFLLGTSCFMKTRNS